MGCFPISVVTAQVLTDNSAVRLGDPRMASSAADVPKLKRQLFNKPAWSKPQASTATTDVFSRSHLTFVNVAEEERLKRKRRLEKKEAKLKAQGGSEKRETKRLRVSDDNSEDEDDEESRDAGQVQEKETEGAKQGEASSSSAATAKEPAEIPKAKSLAKAYEDTIAFARIQLEKTLSSNIIELGSDGESNVEQHIDDDLVVTEVMQKKPPQEDELDSDEEFPELVHKARERARLKRFQAEQATMNLSPTPIPDVDGVRSQTQHAVTPPLPPPPEPIIAILITSEIPNTEPLIVHRKISQSLKPVRIAWCHRQEFDVEITSSIILTWRGRRLYDVTTCRSLGIGVDADGNVLLKGEKDVLGEADRQIHMEAMTEKVFEEKKRMKDRERSPTIVEQDTQEVEVVNSEPKQEKQVRIILKAKGLPDQKLIVKLVCRSRSFYGRMSLTIGQSTTIQRVISAFRMEHKIDSAKEVSLRFDGERLEPSATVQESDLSDLDFIDAHIR